jgi:hypothetical protein
MLSFRKEKFDSKSWCRTDCQVIPRKNPRLRCLRVLEPIVWRQISVMACCTIRSSLHSYVLSRSIIVCPCIPSSTQTTSYSMQSFPQLCSNSITIRGHVITETNRIHLALFVLQNGVFGPIRHPYIGWASQALMHTRSLWIGPRRVKGKKENGAMVLTYQSSDKKTVSNGACTQCQSQVQR